MDNYYRKLHQALDLNFLRGLTAHYYGSEGQESIDPVVFFKILTVGFLNNIHSDRHLMAFCADSLAIRLFLGYDIDEALPWHSTISRTRQLYGEEVFLGLFQKVLSLCNSKGMVSGKRLAIDSAFIKSNASMDSLLEKQVIADGFQYAKELNEQSEFKVSTEKKTDNNEGDSKPEDNLPTNPEDTLPTIPEENLPTKSEDKEQIKQTDDHKNEDRPKRTSNKTHFSKSDPDARISTKPGKPCHLNYYGQIAVDDAHHVITGAMADYANKRDSDCLPAILDQTMDNLASIDLQINQIVADTNYSSGSALSYCEERNIDAYIPNIGGYQPLREGFVFNEELDQFECERGNKAILGFKGLTDNNRIYRSSQASCKGCVFFESCCKNEKYKRIKVSIDKPYYDRMHDKLKAGNTAKFMSRRRSRTVEPVLGTLINYMNMKKVNTRGIKQANKHVLMAAMSYNLKKLMSFMIFKEPKGIAKALAIPREAFLNLKTGFILALYSKMSPCFFTD